ncbi:winged helix-turn-helix transcriptional regulator [Actinomarinicola tropica]|uniref:Transcriptional regulator n=1 Tax=Actinomarinicola tropica TaxID=2789776 RepID=A0A5Q2RFD3_9ACTN|nr:helix-turn-helix domain-containing protein [Actinomarinicola tropica]QGG94344.1 transcriptional regulator [Actinomarinicola tropica]
MRRKSFEDMRCSIAQALEVVGEWWTLLVVRDLLLGVTRFEELQERLGIARNVLTDRLRTLVDAGVVERRKYQDNPERFEYRLTEKGRDLWVVVTAMREWGDRWSAPDGPPVELVHRTCGERTTLVPTCSSCGEVLERRDLVAVPGPGGGKVPRPRS